MREAQTPIVRRFYGVLAAGLLVRLLVLAFTPSLGPGIVDENHYRQLALSLTAGDGFAWGPGQPTSIRPPLYPGLLASVWWLVGRESLQVVRFLQILIALATAVLVYFLGSRVGGSRVGVLAAGTFWLYPTLLFFNFLILTETLFTFLLVAFVLLTVMIVQAAGPEVRADAAVTVACGTTLGLAALTRSIMWPVPALLCPLLALMIRGSLLRRLALPAMVLAGYALVVTPWAVRNTRLQGITTVVDTMGGLNLRMGNYEHTPDDRMWDAVGLTGEKSWAIGLEEDFPGQSAITEGQKDRWAQRKAIDYMLANPGTTLRRSLIKFADFWGLEREFIAGVQRGLFTVPAWVAALGTGLMLLAYVGVSAGGVAGIWLTPPHDWRPHVLLLLPIVLIAGLHTLVFGHSRYHLPLVPLLAIYGALYCTSESRLSSPVARLGAVLTVGALLAIWVRQVVVVDLDRILGLLAS